MEPKIISDPLEVDDELEAMGLDKVGLLGAIGLARHDWSLCTKFDPIGFANTMAYGRCGRGLRESFVPRNTGWQAADWNNQCGISNSDKKLRVVPCNFTEDAGNELGRPTNRSPKGEVTARNALCNRTEYFPGFFDDEPEPDLEAFSSDGYQNWVLGIFFDEKKRNGAELSLPVAMKGRQISKFGRRLILIDSSGKEIDPGKSKQTDDATDIVDIAVTKK